MNNIVDEEACKTYRQLKESESVKSTNMWVGSHEVETHSTHIIENGKFIPVSLDYPFSIVQVGMENIANMLDRLNECSSVDTFRISFDEKTGEISMFNNGPSIPVVKVRDSDGKEIWLPEMLCTKFLSGSNHDKTASHKRISLGVHGIGLKATTSMSVIMKIECVDTENKLYYSQIVKDCNTIIISPDIKPISKAPSDIKKGGTRFTFIIDFAHYKKLPDNIFTTLNNIFYAKAYQVAAYSGINIFYNNNKIPIKNAKQLADMYFNDKPAYFELAHEEWGLSIAIGPPTVCGKGERISIINGGYIESGIHFEWILDHIAADARTKVEKMLKDKVKWRKNLVTANLSVMIVGSLPDLIFDSQIKNNLRMKNHKEYMSKYVWPKTYINKVWPFIEEALGSQYIVKSETTTKKRTAIINVDKYIPAYKRGDEKSDLLLFEGDSAKSSARTAMADASIPFSREYIGIFLLGGCPINVLKNLSTRKFGGITYLDPNKKLINNTIWCDLVTAMGLEYGVVYNSLNIKKLNYRKITCVVDKDPHGMGKIGPIVISNIYYFWPELLDIPGFLGYMDTPLIRAYPNDKKKKVMEFKSQDEFTEWSKQFEGSNVSGWNVKWYKGLATHSNKECSRMFGQYDKLRIAYCDEQKRSAMAIKSYFGSDTELRKELLMSPPVPIPYIEDRKEVDLSSCLDYYTKEEQQYNIKCKINHMIDGCILSHRRILWGVIDYIKNKKNKESKVYQLGAYIAEKFGYHHGDSSLYGAIIWMTQDYIGARNIPIGLPISQFGTRFSNDDAGAPRYIDICGNPIVLDIYPAEDMELLEMDIEDGKATIPKHLVPILPIHILETSSLCGTGWAIRKLARHYKDVIENINRLLDGKAMTRMRPWTPNWKGNIIEIDNVEWTVGTCTYNNATSEVTITELPYQVANDSYINGNIKHKKIVEDRGDLWQDKCLLNRNLIDHKTIIDSSTMQNIHITFKLLPGAIDKINESHGSENFSPLQDYLYLKKHYHLGLNFVDDSGIVKTFYSYESAMCPWFLERWKMYPARFARMKIILELQIMLAKNKLRYIDEHKILDLPEKEDNEQDNILKTAGFIKFDAARIKSPGVPNAKIHEVVFGKDASYNYLLMNHRQMGKKFIEKLRLKIKFCEDELVRLSKSDIVRTTWMGEIQVIVAQIEKAHANGGWVFDGDHVF
jgi:DNA topoisomerase-2